MNRMLRAVALALPLCLAGCTELSGPEAFAPMLSSQKVDLAFGALGNNQAVQSLEVLASAFSYTGAAPRYPGSYRIRDLGPLGRVISAIGAAAPNGVFPCTACIGKTFTYNNQTGRYQPSDVTGAPANGLRYLLYAVNPATHTVMLPLQQLGYVDLADKSGQGANTMGVNAVVNGSTVLSYDASGSISTGTLNFTAKGYVTDGTNRIDFDLSQTVSSTGNVHVDYKITIASQANVAIEMILDAKASGSASSSFLLTENGNQLEILLAGTQTSASGSVKYNGKTLASITASGSADPTFAGVAGRFLSADDLTGLLKLFRKVDQFFTGFDDMLSPSYFVFGIARTN